jgi:vacuolar protein sorting-associated protein 45
VLIDPSQDIVLSASSDPFFSQNLFANFGDLGAAIATYVSDYQSKNSSIAGGAAGSSRIETVADMKRFVEEYPEFRRLGGNVTKHVTLVGELSRLVERDDLLAISEVEQSLASQESHQADLRVSTARPPPRSCSTSTDHLGGDDSHRARLGDRETDRDDLRRDRTMLIHIFRRAS